ncbi:MAG: EspA/EspE family type VII secretion system effector [Planctomycetota bacterium]
MSFLNGFHDLVYCVQRAQGIGASAYQGDDVGIGLNSGGMVGKGLWYGRNQIPALQEALKKFSDPENLLMKNGLPTPTAVVDVCMVIVSVIDLTFNGFAVPDQGAGFATGVDRLKLVKQDLDSAIPDVRDWDGKAAQFYSDQTKTLMSLVQNQKDLNSQMQGLMSDQAAAVTAAKHGCAGALLGLVLAQGVALCLYLKPIYGPAISLYWQLAASVAAMGVVLTYESKAIENSVSVEAEVEARIDQYNKVAEYAKTIASGMSVTIGTAATPGTTVGSFTSTRASTPIRGAPTLHPPAVMATSSATQEQATLSALTAAIPTGSDIPPPATPTAATTPPGVNPVIPAQPQQTTPVVGRGQRAAPSAEKPTTAAAAPRAGNDTEDAEAGAGAAGRAPVQGAVAGAAETQRPASAEWSG